MDFKNGFIVTKLLEALLIKTISLAISNVFCTLTHKTIYIYFLSPQSAKQGI